MPEYIVKHGDCIEKIAEKFGFFWETLWDDPHNAELKKKREDPNVMFPRDVVFVPEKRVKEESKATEQQHRFRKKGVPSMLRLCLLEDDEPRANEPYILKVDAELFSGTTDAQGKIKHSIPPSARQGKLIVEHPDEEHREEYTLDLGGLDPISELTGVQARLNNLSFDCGEVDGKMGPRTRAALKRFQEKHDLPATGQLDEETREKLRKVHGF